MLTPISQVLTKAGYRLIVWGGGGFWKKKELEFHFWQAKTIWAT